MNRDALIEEAKQFVEQEDANYIASEIAISEKVVGLKIFDAPIFAFGDPDDAYFSLFKVPSVIGEHFMPPKEWVSEAQTVISFFLPFTKEVKESNRFDKFLPSAEWLHGRIEGQNVVRKLCEHLNHKIQSEGYISTIPSADKRFKIVKDLASTTTPFSSNWSERHAAFVCGLGTFGLSKGLITEKGMAGRFGSIITNLKLEKTQRTYKDIYEYCTMCGACTQKCPVDAITIETGKDHILCSDYVDQIEEKYKPRYGCGKCQVGIPCESQIPKPFT